MRLRRAEMAKKRKKEKKQEEEYEFKPPEFNEREFLEKELRDTRAAIATVAVAVMFGIIAGVVTVLSRGLVGLAFIVGIAGIFSLKFLYQIIGVDISGFTKKNWAGTVATYFFTFLAIWVLLMNTPFADLTDPSVDNVTVWVSDGAVLTGIAYKKSESTGAMAWMRMDNNASPEGLIHTSGSYTINITAQVADSGGIAVAEISLNSSTSSYYLMTKDSWGDFAFSFTGDQISGQSVLTFFIHAKDKHGNERLFSPGSIPVLP